LYYADNNAYPAGSGIVLGDTNYACLNASGFTTANCASPYMGVVPSDPSTNAYTYTVASSTTAYTLAATLEGTVGNLAAGAVTATQNGLSN
jgi:hypothetical protein